MGTSIASVNCGEVYKPEAYRKSNSKDPVAEQIRRNLSNALLCGSSLAQDAVNIVVGWTPFHAVCFGGRNLEPNELEAEINRADLRNPEHVRAIVGGYSDALAEDLVPGATRELYERYKAQFEQVLKTASCSPEGS